VDSVGNLFILGNSRVRKVSPQGIITTFAGNGAVGFSGDGGPATSASLGDFAWCNRFCGGVAVDKAGNLFIADPGNSRVRKVSPDGIITTVAGDGTLGSSGDGGPAIRAQLDSPAGVAVDGAGNLFIAESGRVRKVSSDGIIHTVAGGGTLPGSSADGGLATGAWLSFPVAVAVDEAGNLFIADPGWNFYTGDAGVGPADDRIRKVSPTGIITTLAGIGEPGFSGDDGAAITAKLNGPGGLAVDGAGNVYVADVGNNVVRILRPTSKSVLIGAVVDAASQRAAPVAPGKLMVIYGAGLGPLQPVSQPNRFTTELGGTTVSFNGTPAEILYSSATQIAAIAPDLLAGATAQIVVAYHGEGSDPFAVQVAPSAPGLFTSNQAGAGQAAALNSDGTVNSAANPINTGDSITLYATGEGLVAIPDPPYLTACDALLHPGLPVSVIIGGIPATVECAGRRPGEGIMQVTLQVPNGVEPGGYVPVVLKVGDASTLSGAVWIAVAAN